MGFTKFATLDVSVLEVKSAPSQDRTASLDKFSDFDEYRTEDGYLYVRIRAISSRVNKNHDGWPSVELAGGPDVFDRHHASSGFVVAADTKAKTGYSTFLRKPFFVDHHNSNPDRTRGVIVDSKLHVEDARTASSLDSYYASAPDNHKPPTWVELLIEVDAKSFPRLARALIEGAKDPSRGIDGFSMGCNVEMSKCSHCGNEATSPDEYCQHIQMKGRNFPYTDPRTGRTSSKNSYEDCYGIQFFEISAVFDPADETALVREVRASAPKTADFGVPCPSCKGHSVIPAANHGVVECPACRSTGTTGDVIPGQVAGGDGINTPSRVRPGEATMDPINPGHAPAYGAAVFHQPEVGEIEQLARRIVLDNPGMSLEEAMTFAQSELQNRFNVPAGSAYGEGASPQLKVKDTTPLPQGFPALTTPLDTGLRPQGKTAAENPLPQSDLLRSPEPVNTLRDEEVCPVCGETMDDEECPLCHYVKQPEGMDNPDLSKAQQTDLHHSPVPPKVPLDETELQDKTLPVPAMPGVPPRNQGPLSHVTGDMAKWTVLDKVAGRINSVERPIRPGPGQATSEPQEQILSDQTKPVTSSVRTAAEFIAAAGRQTGENMKTADSADTVATPDKRVDVVGVGGLLDASNEQASKAEAQIDVTGVGGTGVENVSPESTQSIEDSSAQAGGYDTSKQIEGTPTATFPNEGQQDPVTNVAFPAPEESVKKSHDDGAFPAEDGGLAGGTAVQGVKPIAEQFGERVDLLDHTTSPSNNSGPTTTWNGTDGNGVTKQVDPVTPESIAAEGFGKGSSAHLFAAFKLADLEVELGLTSADKKFDRVAQLEQEEPSIVVASLNYAKRVKTAGLGRADLRTARRLPVLGRNASASGDTGASVESTDTSNEDSSLFL